MKLVFKGLKYVVYYASEDEVAKAQKSGLFIQREGQLYTRDNKRVIIVSAPIEAHDSNQSCNRSNNPFPYIYAKEIDGDYIVSAYGSVNNINSNMIYTNWHVINNASKIKLCNNGVTLVESRIWKPKIIPLWAYSLITWIQRYIPQVKPAYSFFDYAELIAPFDVQDLLNWSIKPSLVYTAGTCSDVNQQNCVGVALQIPLPGAYAPAPSDLPVQYTGYCTYWGYEFNGEVIDYGESTVYYEDGVAVFKNAYLLNFFDKAGIPGCSGSPIIVKYNNQSDVIGSRVSVSVSIRKVG